MHGLAKLALVVASMGVTTGLHAVDRGQFNDVPANIRSWFKSVTGPSGVPCCHRNSKQSTRASRSGEACTRMRVRVSAAEKLGVPEEKVVINIERFGNTTAATIPLALNDAVADKRLRRGDLLLMVSVGAGFTVGSLLLRWGLKE